MNGKIEKVSIDIVKPYWRNARILTTAVDNLVLSIEDYGYNQPIIVDNDFVIIAGHARYKALRQLNFKEIEVQIVDLSPKDAKKFRLADNMVRESSKWDNDKLIAELQEISSVAFIQHHFSDIDLSKIRMDDMIDSDEIKEETAINTEVTDKGLYTVCPCCGEYIKIEKDGGAN